MGNRTRDRTGTDTEAIGTITLSDAADDSSGVHVDEVGASPGNNVAVDGTGAVNREGQDVVAQQVGQADRAAATVADIRIDAGAGSEYASRLRLLYCQT
ncbi:hypothetical protein D3C87_1545060 [compost metagenome]